MVAPDLHDRHVYVRPGRLHGCVACRSRRWASTSRTSTPRASPPPAAIATSSVPVNDAEPTAEQVTIELAKTGRRITGSKRQSLLEIAESHNVELDYGCRVGNCGDCRLKVLSGDVNPGAGPPRSRRQEGGLRLVARRGRRATA